MKQKLEGAAAINPSIVRYQRLAIWSGVLFATLFFVALLMAGFIPPPSPQLSGPELMTLYHDRLVWVKAAMPVAILAAGLSLPWNAVIAGHIARIEGQSGGMPILAITSFGAGTINTLFFYLPFIFWAGAFFRADRNPELLQLMSDTAWLAVVMLFSAAFVQNLCIALAGFADKSDRPVFPRWSCFAILWIAILFVPGALGIFFFSGPFAWNGLIVFWIPATVFGSEIMLLAYVMLSYLKSIG